MFRAVYEFVGKRPGCAEMVKAKEGNAKRVGAFPGRSKKWLDALPFDYLMIVLEKCSALVKLFSDLCFPPMKAGNKTGRVGDRTVKKPVMNVAAGKARVLSPGDGEVEILRKL